MKKLFAVVLVVALLAAMIGTAATALAGNGNGGKPDGAIKLAYNLNIIGKGNYGNLEEYGKEYTGNGCNENRHTIFIPLKTDYYTDPCDTDAGEGDTNNPGAKGDPVLLPEKGVSLNIVAGDRFAVLDCDATQLDGGKREATLQVPYDPDTDNPVYGVFLQANGKPNNCMDVEFYTELDDEVIFLGMVDVDRSRGKPQKINITNMLYSGNIAYFADPYENYFWQMYNNGVRLMKVRFYEMAE